MWAKSIITPVVLIPTLVILQISYGKPAGDSETSEVPSTLPVEDANSSLYLQTVSFLITVLSPNDTSSPTLPKDLLLDANLTATEEPEYYLEDGGSLENSTNATSSNASSDLDGDWDMFRTGYSSESTLMTEEEIAAAGSLDEHVTASLDEHVSVGDRGDPAAKAASHQNEDELVQSGYSTTSSSAAEEETVQPPSQLKDDNAEEKEDFAKGLMVVTPEMESVATTDNPQDETTPVAD